MAPIVLKDKYYLVNKHGAVNGLPMISFLEMCRELVIDAIYENIDDIEPVVSDCGLLSYTAEQFELIKMLKLNEIHHIAKVFDNQFLTRFKVEDVDICFEHIQERSHTIENPRSRPDQIDGIKRRSRIVIRGDL